MKDLKEKKTMFNRFVCKTGIVGFSLFFAVLTHGTTSAAQQTINAELSTAPNVPSPIKRNTSAMVVVNLEAKEYVGTLAKGVQYKFWSFNGTVPGPMIRVRQGDTVKVNLTNPRGNAFSHNIDLHAVNGPGGGALDVVYPGKEAAFEFKALVPGLYIYHCASPTPNIPTHIANGMYGLVLVEPEKGMPQVDKEFYVMESEFFTQPSDKDGFYVLSMEKGAAENADHVVFNGHAEALMGDNALQARVGNRVRIYFGNIGPNSASSFHVIGEIFDKVYVEGAIGGAINRNVQTTLVPSAGAVIVEFKVDVPGSYVLVDHSIFRVFKGAIGLLNVTGPENPQIYKILKK
jgi:nitrite reductase (NO-forming)